MNGQTNHLLRAIIIWIVASVVGVVVVLLVGPQLAGWGVLPPVASNRANDVDQVLAVFTLAAVPVFMGVVVFAAYAVFTFRSPERPTSDGPSVRGHGPFQVAWLVVSIVLVVFLFGYGLYYYNQLQTASAAGPLVVKVNGEQWLWDYYYPQYGNISSTTLELPVNRPVQFDITSIDVQHSFWIPAMAVKQDAVPGVTTHITATPTQMGTYEVRCAELCGVYHAYMETPVNVVSESDFESWVATLQSGGSARISSPVGTVAWITSDADSRTYGMLEGQAA